MNSKRHGTSMSTWVVRVGVVLGIAAGWLGAGAVSASAGQDLGDRQVLEAFMGMPEDLAESPGTIVHAGVSSSRTLVEFRLGVVRDGQDLDAELAAVTAELADDGWQLSDPRDHPASFELDGARGDDETILVTIESQPDGSVGVLYMLSVARDAPDASPPGSLLQDVGQLRVDDSLTLESVQLMVTTVPLRITGVLGPRDLDVGSSLLVDLRGPAANADAVNQGVMNLCTRSGFECPDGLEDLGGAVVGTLRIPGGAEGRISTTLVPGADLISVHFNSFGPDRISLPDVSIPTVGEVGGVGGDGDHTPSSADGRSGSGSEDGSSGADTGGGDTLLRPAIVAPSVVVVGIFLLGFVGIRRRRRPDDGEPDTERRPNPSPVAGPVPDAFGSTPPVGRVEAAVRLLEGAAARGGQRVELQAARAGHGSVEVLLATPVALPSSRFESDDGRVWSIADDALAGSTDRDATAFGPPTHALVCVGYLAGDPVIIDLADGITQVRGETADVDGLMQSWAAELAEERWSNRPAVLALGAPIERADTAKVDEESLRSIAARRTGRPLVVFTNDGDAAVAVTSDADAGVVCRTLGAGAPTRTVMIDGGRIQVEPAGLDLDLMAEEVDPPDAPPAREQTIEAATVEGAPPVVDGSVGRPVLVRVLGSVTIDGAENVAMRRSKVKECIVYLAFHRDGVTGDQVLAALWPDGSSRRAWLNQTVSRARQAMGNGSDGKPIIRYVSGGRYGASPELITDLELLDAALASGSPIDGLIVGGTPFSADEGYEWAHREGHVARANLLIERATQAETEAEGTQPA